MNDGAASADGAVEPCAPPEAAARLKQLALDSSPLLATPRNNGVNINVALNNQVRTSRRDAPVVWNQKEQRFCVKRVSSLPVCLPLPPLQEDVVKLTEKCGLSSSTSSSSPVATPRRTPEDLKSNILKAQVEAAALLVSDRQSSD